MVSQENNMKTEGSYLAIIVKMFIFFSKIPKQTIDMIKNKPSLIMPAHIFFGSKCPNSTGKFGPGDLE